MKMNETMKRSPLARRIALLLAAVLLLGMLTPILSACSPNVMALDGVAIDREMYAFWFSMCKTDAMRRYGIKSTQDTEAFWSSACNVEGKEGKTWGEVVTEDVTRAIKQKLAAALLYDEMGLAMTKPQKNKIKSYLDDMVAYVSNGDKGDLRDELDRYSSSFAALRRCAAFDMKATLVLSYLARNGEELLTTEEKAGFYADSYYRVKIVYVNNSVYGRFEDGVRVETALSFTGPGAYNDANKKLMADILDVYYDTGELPEDFDETFEALLGRSDEEIHGEEAYPDGIYVTRTIDLSGGLLEEEVFDAARGLKAGQLAHVTTENGERYLYGYALETAAYDNEDLAPFFSDFYENCANRALTARNLARIADVVSLPEKLTDVNIYTIHCNLDFKLCNIE